MMVSHQKYEQRMDSVKNTHSMYNADYYESYREGYEEGYAEGLKEGKVQMQFSVARTMLADGMSYDMIMKYTGLSQEQIAQLAAQGE